MRVAYPFQVHRDRPCGRYDQNSFGAGKVAQFLREQKLHVRQALELDELDAIVKMVRSGLGVALVPLAGLWLENASDVRVIPLQALTFHREIVLLTRYQQRHAPLFNLFRTCVMDAMAKHSAQSWQARASS